MALDPRAQLQATLGDAFHVGRELGGGGMSRVFLTEEVALRRQIVVKLLPPEMAAELSIARFQREIALAAQLQHPHIVSLLSYGESGGLPYYTMPYVEGESLRDRLTRGRELPVVEGIRLLREIASALAYAHEKGIVHRDIKPENVLLSGGIALVSDFGVAKAIVSATASGAAPLTATGVAIGTPAYMSPEQITADPATDQRADIYALGVIAYEMFAGKPPFTGSTAQSLIAAHVIDTPEPLTKHRPAVPPALAALVMRCLEKRAADRPQSAEEFMRALDAMTTPSQTTASFPNRTGWSSRAMASALAVVVVLAAGGAWLMLGKTARAGATSNSRLLIAPFENYTGDARFDQVGRYAADRMAMLVAQAGTVEVVPANMVLLSLRDTASGQLNQLKRLSEASNAGLLVSGSVVVRGDSIVLQAEVTDVHTGKTVVSLSPVSSVASDPVAAVDALADRLNGALGGRALAIVSLNHRAPKYAASQEFDKGYHLFAVQGDNFRSRPFFEKAIEIDPDYAHAYLLLQRQYLQAREYDRADTMARRIERLPLGLYKAERLSLDYANAELNGDIGARLRAQQQLVAIDSSALALRLVGEAANYLLQPGLAVPALEQSKASFQVVGGRAEAGHASDLAEGYHQLGQNERELSVLAASLVRFPDVTALRGQQLRTLAALGRPAAALALADTLLRGEDDSAGFHLSMIAQGASEFRAHGDAGTSARLFGFARQWIGAHAVREPTPSRAMAEGMVMLGAGMPDSAAIRFAKLARDTSMLGAEGYLVLAQIARGDRAHAGAVADSIGALHRRWLFGRQTFWRAAIHGALGDKDMAVQLLRQAQHEGQTMERWHYEPALASLQDYPAFEALVRPQR